MKYRTQDRKIAELNNQRLTSAREAQNAYTREWRKKNPDKVRQYNQNYWARKAEKDAVAL